MSDFVSGWRQDRENTAALALSSLPHWRDKVAGKYATPDEIDPRPFVVVEDQSRQGACQGHAISSIVEHCYHIATGDAVQLSRQFAYIESQKLDGIQGDRGSTISAGCALARATGIPREELWPYTGQYITTPPGNRSDLLADAKRYVVNGEAPIRSYDDGFEFLAAGIGGIEIGVEWWSSMSQDDGTMDSIGGSFLGLHAMSFLGYSTRKDSKGRRYWWLLNSHGKRWANQGWSEVSPALIESMIQKRGNVFRGVSDMTGDAVQARDVDWVKDSYKRDRRFS